MHPSVDHVNHPVGDGQDPFVMGHDDRSTAALAREPAQRRENPATGVTVEDRLTVAGAEASHISAGLASEGTEYLIEQFYLNS